MNIRRRTCEHIDYDRVVRAPRTWWMYLLPGLRLYRCDACGAKFLASKTRMDTQRWMHTTSRNAAPQHRSLER